MIDTADRRLANKVIQAALRHPELRQERYRDERNMYAGLCYVVCETLFHAGMRERGWTPAQFVHEDTSHWVLMQDDGSICDPTWRQFASPPNYAKARRRAFRTTAPSKRARVLLEELDERRETTL